MPNIFNGPGNPGPAKPGAPGKGNINININIEDYKNMKCWCGCEEFNRVYQLRYVPAMVLGQRGGTIHLMQYECRCCGYRYKEALPQDEIDKLRKHQLGIDPDVKNPE